MTSGTTTSGELAAKYESENQAILEAYQAMSCTVVRDSQGRVVQAVVEYPDGTAEPIYHICARDVVGPVSVTSSTRRESPQSEWEIPLPPTPDADDDGDDRSRVRSATPDDLDRDFGSANLVIGFPVVPRPDGGAGSGSSVDPLDDDDP